MAITDHECLSSHIEVNRYAKKIKDKHPDFKVALGNEIYLVDSRENGQRYYHFLLLAKDAIGHKALRELSSIAWINSYFDRGMERVPVLKSELKEVLTKYKGHVIATTACLGGELSVNLLKMIDAERVGDQSTAALHHGEIVKFLLYCKEVFEDDFYLECAPANNKQQIEVNKRMVSVARAFNTKMVFGTDSHYLSKDERWVHKAYLNSKNGEREVDDFYEFSYLMTTEEVFDYLKLSYEEDFIHEMVSNTNEINSKITEYDLAKNQIIPRVKVHNYSALGYSFSNNTYPTLDYLFNSDEIQERYWVNECINQLRGIKLDNPEYLQRLEEEADIVKYIGDKLGQCLFAYFNTFQHYIDLFWECGSIVGPGRGSATGFLSNYLLGITQLDPIQWKLPHWRFLNKERAELPKLYWAVVKKECELRSQVCA